MKIEHEEILTNSITPLCAADHTDCQECTENLMFVMRDNYHDFSMSMSTLLHCLSIAEQEGYVPKLPYEWWNNVHTY